MENQVCLHPAFMAENLHRQRSTRVSPDLRSYKQEQSEFKAWVQSEARNIFCSTRCVRVFQIDQNPAMRAMSLGPWSPRSTPRGRAAAAV